nr:YoaK family protein [uncultured Lachnoclostridium sp.]
MREKAKIYQCIHYNMAVCGGFLGAYAILNRCDVLGNAQTSNLIYLTLNIIGRDAWQVMIRIGAMLLYMLATMCTVLIPKYTKWNLRVISVLVDMIAVGILALLPEEMDNIVALYPVFFAMAFQWNTFANLCEYVSSTIFSTNNVRQMTISFTKYICDRKEEDAKRGRFFAGVLLFYHIGVAISYFAWKTMKMRGVLIGIIPMISALGLISYEAGWITLKHRAVEKIENK